MKKLLFILFAFSHIFSNQQANDEIYGRKIDSPPIHLDKEIKIVVYSVIRVGSKLIRNIMTYLFEEGSSFSENGKHRIEKYHGGYAQVNSVLSKYPKSLVVIPIRNPLDSAKSVCTRLQAKNLQEVEKVLCRMRSTMLKIKDFHNIYKSRTNILVVRYEDFVDDFDYFLDKLEEHLQIVISRMLRDKIQSLFSVRATKEAVKDYEDKDHPVREMDNRHVKVPTTSFAKSDEFREFATDIFSDPTAVWGY